MKEMVFIFSYIYKKYNVDVCKYCKLMLEDCERLDGK